MFPGERVMEGGQGDQLTPDMGVKLKPHFEAILLARISRRVERILSRVLGAVVGRVRAVARMVLRNFFHARTRMRILFMESLWVIKTIERREWRRRLGCRTGHMGRFGSNCGCCCDSWYAKDGPEARGDWDVLS